MNKLSKIDTGMLDAADIIHRDLVDGVSTNIYSHQIEYDGTGMAQRLQKKGYVDIIKNPNRGGNAYKWLHGELRPYQIYMKQLIKDSKDGFTIAVLPTGTGKTKTALSLIHEYSRTLFVTPRINLTHQTASVFGDSLEVGIMQGSKSKNIGAAHIVANLQTLTRRVDELPEFDLVLWDEVHYSFKQIQQLITKLPNAKHIGLTATAYTAAGIPLCDSIIEPFDIQYFIKRGYLANLVQYQAMTVDEKKLKRSSTGDFTQRSIEEVTDDVFSKNVIKATKDALRGQTLVFASSINHCNQLSIGYKKAGFKVLTLHSQQKNPQRILQSFKNGDAQILVTVDMVSFGTDIPAVVTGIIARPVGSKSLWRQMVGRILRTAPDKGEALLLDCGGNLKRLGNPLAPAKPNEAKVIASPSCAECGYEKAPYLKNLIQNFNEVIRIYRCAACSHEHEEQSDLDTIVCESCNRYYLASDTVIIDDCEVLNCACGHTTNVMMLDDLELVLSDDELLSRKLKAAFMDSTEDELLSVSQATAIIMTAINNEVYERSTILMMLEQKSILDVANALKSPVKIEPVDADHVRVERLIREMNLYKTKQLNDSEIQQFMSEFDNCQLSHKARAVETRLHTLEEKNQPITYIKNFIPYIEQHSRNSGH